MPPGKKRTRSGTNSSTQTSTPMNMAEEKFTHSKTPSSNDVGSKTPTREAFSIEEPHPESLPTPTETEMMPEIPSDDSKAEADQVDTPTATSTVIASPLPSITDDSDTDFQSAYSASPRDKYADLEEEEGSGIEDRMSTRGRTISTATAIISSNKALVSTS